MVIAPTTQIDPSRVTYLKGKSPEQIDRAAAVHQPSHAEMVGVVTRFIDGLINLEVERLEATASDNSNAEAHKSLNKYNEEKDSITSFKREVTSDLAKNIYAVKQFLIEDHLATEQADTPTLFLPLAENSLNDSAKELAQEALALVHQKLSSYGINIDTAKATELQQKILEQLKKPPAPKNQATTTEAPSATEGAGNTTTAATATEQADTATAGTQEAKRPTAEETERSIKNIINASPALATLVKNIKGLDILSARIESIGNVETQSPTPENIKKFNKDIFLHIADEAQFKTAVSKLNDDEKAALKTILTLVHGQADKEITCNEMSAHARNINNRLGANSKSLEAINVDIDKLIQSHGASSETTANQPPNPDNLKKVNKILETFEEELKQAGELLSTKARVTAREAAQAKLIKTLNTSLTNSLINVADLKMLKEVLEKPDSANSSYNKRADKFLKDLNISTDDLKQLGSMAAVLAVGLIVFCPGAINGLVRTGAGLANMAFGNGILPLMLMKYFGGDNNKQGIDPILAMTMMMGNNHRQTNKTA